MNLTPRSLGREKGTCSFRTGRFVITLPYASPTGPARVDVIKTNDLKTQLPLLRLLKCLSVKNNNIYRSSILSEHTHTCARKLKIYTLGENVIKKNTKYFDVIHITSKADTVTVYGKELLRNLCGKLFAIDTHVAQMRFTPAKCGGTSTQPFPICNCRSLRMKYSRDDPVEIFSRCDDSRENERITYPSYLIMNNNKKYGTRERNAGRVERSGGKVAWQI